MTTTQLSLPSGGALSGERLWADRLTGIDALDLNPSTKEDMKWLCAHAIENGLSQEDLAEKIKSSASTLGRIFNGKYAGNVRPFLEKIATYRQLEEGRSIGTPYPEYIRTVQAKRIEDACDVARREGVILPVIGKTQMGKTTALKHYAETTPMTIYVECPAPATMTRLMRRIARACGVKETGDIDVVTDRILEKIGESHVLIVDEIHQATRRPASIATNLMEWLRLEIYDKTHCGMLLCGTSEFTNAVQSGELSGMLAQTIERTAGYIVNLPNAPTKQDVQKIISHYEMPTPDESTHARIVKVALEFSFKKLIGIFRTSSRVASKRGVEMTWELWHEIADAFDRKL